METKSAAKTVTYLKAASHNEPRIQGINLVRSNTSHTVESVSDSLADSVNESRLKM